MLVEWNMGLIIQIFKKGDPIACHSCGGIVLLNTIYKILAALIRNDLPNTQKRNLENISRGLERGDPQMTIQTIENSYKHDMDLHVLFVDFKQAFDSVGRNKLLIDMDKIELPKILIQPTKMSMDN